jgi:hypothetical protein
LACHRLGGEPGQLADPLDRVQHGDLVADQLQRVPVAGDDQHPVAGGAGLGGERGDDVVGLVAGFGEHRDAQRLEHLLGDVDLAAELVGGGRAALLVLRVALLAEGLPGHVEGGGDVGRASRRAAG